MKKDYDKKVAIKLINQYADQYNRINEERSHLVQEVTDLRLNIKVSKEIIESFYKTIPVKDKEELYLTKTREEIALVTKMNNRLNKDIQSLRSKTNYYEQIINKSISDYRESTEYLQEKIFVLENALIKKDSLILTLNNKISKMKDDDVDYSNDDNSNPTKNEIYIIDPSMSVNLIQDDLMLYKQAYENALQKIKENNNVIEKYEKRIDELRGEILKMQPRSSDRGWDNGIIDLSSENTKSSKSEKKNLSNISSLQTIQKEDIDIIIQTEIGMKVMTVIGKCIEDKNQEISRLKAELKEQTANCKKLNEDNMSLLKTIMNNKGKEHNKMIVQSNNSKGTKESFADSYLNTNISMIGNTSGEEKKKRHFITDKLNKIKKQSLSQSMDDPQISLDFI